MSKVLPFLPPVPTPPPDADEHARRETERKWRLFAWADAVLSNSALSKCRRCRTPSRSYARSHCSGRCWLFGRVC
jgi:hypothetical protein